MLKVLFDATTLVDGDDMIEERRGIYFVARKILELFEESHKCQIILFASSYKFAGLEKIRLMLCPSASLLKTPSKATLVLHKIVTFFRRKRMDNFNKPLIRKFYAVWLLLLNFICFCAYFVVNFFQKFDEDIVFFSPRTSAPWFINRNKKIKKFIVLHDLIPYVLPEYANQRHVGWFGYLTRTLNKNDYYFAISEATKKDYCCFSNKIKAEHVSVCHWAADNRFKQHVDLLELECVLLKYQVPTGKKFIFSLCTLEPRKNLLRTVVAFLKFVEKNKISDLLFVIGGGEWNNFKAELKKVFGDNSFEKYVMHVGYVDDEDLPIFYSFAQWFVFTSQYEGFGLPPLEAMQCGCPVITSNTSSLPEVVGDAGIMIDWDNDNQHVAAYEKYYFDEKLRMLNSKKGLQRAKLFSWNKTVDFMIGKMA